MNADDPIKLYFRRCPETGEPLVALSIQTRDKECLAVSMTAWEARQLGMYLIETAARSEDEAATITEDKTT